MILALLACAHRPDAVLLGGVIRTLDPAAPQAQALAIRRGEIVAVGGTDEIAALAGRRTRRVDLAGRVVLPGLIDAHTHLALGGAELQTADLSEAEDLPALLASIAAYAAAHPGEPWVLGGGWSPAAFEGRLDAATLDAAVPDRPALLWSIDGHSAWANSAALRIAGIDASTPDPPGGRIVRDGAGRPTGVLREEAVSLVEQHAPGFSREQIDAGLAAALAEARAAGLTTVLDAAAEPWMLAAYRRAARRGALTARVYAAVPVEPGEGAAGVRRARRAARRGGPAEVIGIKLYLDGVIEAQTAWMLAPYADGTNGEPAFTAAELREIAAAAAEAGLMVHAHAIGDAAVRQALDAHAGSGGWLLLAHLDTIDPADVPRFAEPGVYAVFQPLWAWPDPYVTGLAAPSLGEARAARLYPIGEIAASGGRIAGGSDWSVSSMDPWDAIEVAVTRQDPDAPGGPALGVGQALSAEAAIAAYTTGAAAALRAGDRLGRLAPGYRADFVVLDRDPYAIPPADLSAVQVLETWLEGEPVHPATAP